MRATLAIATALAALAITAAPAAAHELRLDRSPAYAEVIGSERHRAVVITVHGGGWYATGPEAAALERANARAWAALGWTAVNVSYRPGRRSLRDVIAVYDRVRRHVGRSTPVCLAGSSAGGHLALMAAVRRPSVACVVARGAPTDLVSIHRQRAWGPAGPQRRGPAVTRRLAIDAFGRRGLRRMSPMHHARRIRARVLLVAAHHDPLVPRAQLTRFARAARNARVLHLHAGSVPWVHASVSTDGLARAQRAERRLAATAYSSSS